MPYHDGGQGEPTECVQDAVHESSSIQPHGYLFVLDSAGATIVAASRNVSEALKCLPDQLVGRSIGDVLEAADDDAIEFPVVLDANALPKYVCIRGAANRGQYDARAHLTDGYRLIELEPRHETEDIAALLYDSIVATHRIRSSITTEMVLQALVIEIKRLTSFDRVLAVQFDPSWQGKVIAEEKSGGLYSFSGYCFPADDVPDEVRAAYQRHAILAIPDVGYNPSPLVPALPPGCGQPIDLGVTTLGGVSPAQIEYLTDMGVAALLSIPIISGGRVWGAISCHHTAPLQLPQPVRDACRMLTEAASFKLAELEAAAVDKRLGALRGLAGMAVRSTDDQSDQLTAAAPALLEIAAAQGIAVFDGRHVWTAGRVPGRKDVSDLKTWLSANDGDGLFTDRLSEMFAAAAAYRDVASGIAARKLPDGWLIWFRPEWPHTVTWAGDVGVHAPPPRGRPTPRRSFSARPSVVRGQSLGWSPGDVAVVNEANTLVMNIALAERIRRQMETEAVTDAKLRQLQSIANHLPALILYRDRDGRFEFLNRTAEAWLNVRAHDVRGKTVIEAGLAGDWLHPVGANRSREQLTTKYPDGKTRTVDIAQMADIDAFGLLRGEVVLAIDMSEQKASELRQGQANRMNAIGTLTGGMAHDLNNLLGVVIGNLDLLKRLVKSDAMASELCNEALQGAHRGAELIRRLLAFARIQALHPEAVDVNSLVAGSLHALGRSLGDNVVLKLALDPLLWPTIVDPVQLGASLQNLAINAREAMPSGGQLSIVTRNARLDADYAAQHADVTPGAYVLIEIGDTGTGMTPEVVGRIFDPFFTTKGVGKGIGLGLSMVFGFVKQSGGHLSVYSEPGLGTTFRLYLPRHGSDAAPSPSLPGEAEAVTGGNEAVLVVEDNAPLRQTAERQLTDLGYRVRVAEHAGAALTILSEGSPIDLLFTDVVMPGPMNGIELATHAVRLRPDLRVLLTSGFTGVRETGQRNGTGSFRLLSKPYHRDELARTVREVLDHKPVRVGADASIAGDDAP